MIDEINEFIINHCEKLGWDADDDTLRKNLSNTFKATKKFNLKINEKLISDIDVIQYINFPTAPRELFLLNECWMQKKTTKQLSDCGQSAGQVRDLRARGFTFKKDIKKGFLTINEDGKESRMVIGLDPCSVQKNYWNRLSAKEKAIVKKVFRTDFLGISNNPEIDHRIPEEARKEKGLQPTPLTTESLLDGTWIEHYQTLSRSTNCMKRQVCNLCIRGGDIKLPLAMQLFKSCYISKFGEANDPDNPCKGCFYHDSTKPKFEHAFPDLEEVRKDQQKKVDEVKDKINKLESKKIKKKRKKKLYNTLWII